MKFLFCEDCRDLVAPYAAVGQWRFCHCRRHSVQTVDSQGSGVLRVRDARAAGCPPSPERAYVLGIANKLLSAEDAPWTVDFVQALLGRATARYFVESRSLIWRQRPSQLNTVRWEKY